MNRLTEQAREYLNSHSAEIRQLQEVSRALNVSYESLRKTFTRDMGMTLNEYLHSVRLEKTLHLLNDRKRKLYSVAREVGFVNEQNLIRNFKSKTGMTPTEFRRRLERISAGDRYQK